MKTWLIAVRAVHFAASLLPAGVLVFLPLIAWPAMARRHFSQDEAALRFERQALLLAAGGAGLCLFSGAAWLAIVAAQMTGGGFSSALSPNILGTVLARTHFGRLWMARGAMAVVLAGLIFWLRQNVSRKPGLRASAYAAAGLAAIGLAGSLAEAGHAAASGGAAGTAHLAADVIHLLVAAAWLSGLLLLAQFLKPTLGQSPCPAPKAVIAVTRRFSLLGVASVALLTLSGIINAWFLVGGFAALTETVYGRLLILKLALFALMILFGAVNRYRILPSLCLLPAPVPDNRYRTLCHRLRRSVFSELSLGILIVIVVAILGTEPTAREVWRQRQNQKAAHLTTPEALSFLRPSSVKATKSGPVSTRSPATTEKIDAP